MWISTGAVVRAAENLHLVDRLIGNQKTAVACRRVLFWLALCQIATIIASAIAAKLLYIDLFVGSEQAIWLYLAPTLPLAGILLYLSNQIGLHDIDVLVNPTIGFGRLCGALFLSFMLLLGGLYLLKVAELYSRGWFLSWFAISAFALIGARWFAMRGLRSLFEAQRLSRYFGIYGTPSFVDALKEKIEADIPFAVVSGVFVHDSASTDSPERTLPLVELQRAIARGAYETVIIALPVNDVGAISRVTKALAPYAPELLLCTELATMPLPIQGSRTLAGIHAQVLSPVPTSERHWLVKRALDCTIALLGLILLSPLLLAAAIAIKLDSRGPIFFQQKRYGRANEVFRIFKFRTMTVTEDGADIRQAQRNDARVTRVGAILRATSIDELPQLINIVLGQMSIVGPRPHALAHEERFEQDIDLFSRRRRVLPGITGWAQVNGCRGETRTPADVRRRLEYDLYYIDNWCIWFDIEIMARTLVTIARGAH